VAQLTQAVEAEKPTHPGDDFALVHQREQTLCAAFRPCCFCPLGVSTGARSFAPADLLSDLLGRAITADAASVLGQRERVGPPEALMPALFPSAVADCSLSMAHEALGVRRCTRGSTMLGRIMRGPRKP